MESRRISHRLKTIIDLVPDESEVIWDICCDHGIVGKHFLPNRKIIFNDQVPSIIKTLKNSFDGSDIPVERFKIIEQDATKIKFEKSTNKTCFVIVGIGADLIIKILENIPHSNKDHFLLCAHQYNYKLRSFLKKENFKLKSELLCRDDNHFYEIILCHRTRGKTISLIGEQLWMADKEDCISYLNKQIMFFEIKAKYNPVFKLTLNKYEDLLKKFSS